MPITPPPVLFRWLRTSRLLYLGATLVVGCGLLTSLLGFFYLRDRDRGFHVREFNNFSMTCQATLQDRIDEVLGMMQALAGLCHGGEVTDPAIFQRCAAPFVQRHGGMIQAMEWIPRVPHGERQAFEQARQARFPQRPPFRIWERGPGGASVPAGVREVYFPVDLVEPYAGNEVAWGFDLASQPIRRAALEKAASQGIATATGRIRLVQEKGEQFGFLLFLPVYRDGVIPATEEQRRRALRGFILGVFRVGDFLNSALRQVHSRVDGQFLEDLSAPEDERLLARFSSRGEAVQGPRGDVAGGELLPRYEQRLPIRMADRQWQLTITPRRELFAYHALWHGLVLAMGFVGTAVVGLFLVSLIRLSERLRREKGFRDRLIDTSLDGIFAFDTTCRVTVWNARMRAVLGLPPQEALGRALAELPAFRADATLVTLCREVLAEGTRHLEAYVIAAADGARRVYDIDATPLLDQEGETIGGLVRFHDETQNVENRAHVRREGERARQYLEIAGTIIVVLDREMRVRIINRKGCEVLGYRAEELVGNSWIERVIPPEQRADVREVAEKILKGELDAVRYYENAVQTRDGQRRLIAWHNAFTRDSAGNIVSILSSGEDITDRKRIETALRESEIRFRSVFDSALDGILIADAGTHRFVMANAAICRMLGYTEEELTALGVKEIHPPDELPQVVEKFNRQVRRELQIADNIPMLRKDGSVFYADVNATPVSFNGGTYLMGIFRDITDRREAEQRLRESEARFRGMADAARDGIIMIDEQGAVIFWNRGAERIFGYAAAEIMGRNLHHTLAPERMWPAHEANFPRFQQSGAGAAVGRTLELPAVHKDGHEFPVEISLAAVPHLDRWHAVAVVRDISERKRSEERERYAAFLAGVAEMSTSMLHIIGNASMSILNRAGRIEVRSNELEEMAGFFVQLPGLVQEKRAAGVSTEQVLEELNAVFREVGGNLRQLSEKEFKESAGLIRSGVERIAEIIRLHQATSTYSSASSTPFRLDALLHDAVLILSGTLKEHGVTVEIEGADAVGVLELPRNLLLQMMVNLIKNGSEAIRERSVREPAPGLIHISAVALEGERVEIRVWDNGCGIPAGQMQEIFRLGYSTKETSGGMGLHSAANFIQSIGGTIQVQSDGVDQGARFVVRLPRSIWREGHQGRQAAAVVE